MLRVHGLPFVLLVGCLIADGPAQAQGLFQPRRRPPADSHEALPGRPDRKAAEDLLARQLLQTGSARDLFEKDLGAITSLLGDILKDPKRYGLDDDKIAKMVKDVAGRPNDFGIDLNDPKMQELAKKLAGEIELKPEQIEAMKRVIGDVQPLTKIKPPDVVPPDVKPPDVKPPMPIEGQPPMPVEVKPPEASPPAPPPSKNWLAEQVSKVRPSDGLTSDLRERLRGLIGRDSKLGEWTRNLTGDGRRLLPNIDTSGLVRTFGRLIPDNLKLSDSRPKLPSFSAPSFSAPSLAPGGGASSGVGTVLVILLGVGSVVLLLLLLPQTRDWIARKAEGWRLGPWPVAPGSVRTRADVVKAFEYLALLRLGRQAGSANHLDIARRLGTHDRQKAAVLELADLYEQARYAPPQELLSDDQMETARRDLSFLAGAAAA